MPGKFLPATEYTKTDKGWHFKLHLTEDKVIDEGIIDELPERIKDRLDNSSREELQ